METHFSVPYFLLPIFVRCNIFRGRTFNSATIIPILVEFSSVNRTAVHPVAPVLGVMVILLGFFFPPPAPHQQVGIGRSLSLHWDSRTPSGDSGRWSPLTSHTRMNSR